MTQRSKLESSDSKNIQLPGTVGRLRSIFEGAPIQGQDKKCCEKEIKKAAKQPTNEILDQLKKIEKLQNLLAQLDLLSQTDPNIDRQALCLAMTMIAQDETDLGDKNMFKSAETIIRELAKSDCRFNQMAIMIFGKFSVSSNKECQVIPQPAVSGKGLMKFHSVSTS